MSKAITIEQLARLCQHEFKSIRAENDEMRTDILSGFGSMENKFDALAQVLRDTRDDIKDLKRNAVDVLDLELRVKRIERKIGLKK